MGRRLANRRTAEAQAAAKAALAKVRGNLEGRDKFIVENGLWDEFVAQLPELSGTKKAPPAEPTGLMIFYRDSRYGPDGTCFSCAKVERGSKD